MQSYSAVERTARVVWLLIASLAAILNWRTNSWEVGQLEKVRFWMNAGKRS